MTPALILCALGRHKWRKPSFWMGGYTISCDRCRAQETVWEVER